MFFMIGVWPGKKDLGVIDGYRIYMTYNSIIIFFIPTFRFGKEYYAEKAGTTYRVDPEIGKRIEHGEDVSLNFTADDTQDSSGKICMRCGFRTDNPEFTHCPKCGNLLVSEK